MKRALPINSDVAQKDEDALARYRRALRRSDQIVFDDLVTPAQEHLETARKTTDLLSYENFLLCVILEEHKEVMRLRNIVDRLKE
jgi:hypothetical protein